LSEKPVPTFSPPAQATPHYHGHRERLREKFRKAGAEALGEYELLELILFRALPRRDVKPLAKAMIARFGSFAEALSARPERLREIDGLGEAAIVELKIVEAAAKSLAKATIGKRLTLSSFNAVVDYCRTAMAFLDREEFRVLFLDRKNGLIADEVLGQGTIDHAPVYLREILRRALELGACALILVHNHPSGDPQPSADDIHITRQLMEAGQPLKIVVHDHLIVGKQGHVSLKGLKLI